jgi:hypothetical protein
MKSTLRCFCWKIIFSRQTTSSCEGCWLRLPRLSGFGFNTTLLVLNCTDLAKITFSVSKKIFWKYFSTDLKIRKIIFMPNPLGNLLIILGTGHFSSFRARKVKLTKLLTQPYISVPRQVTFFFFFHQLKGQYCFPRQTLRKIIYSYWEEAIFQVSEPESKN